MTLLAICTPNVYILVSNVIILQKAPRLLVEMTDSRTKAGKIQGDHGAWKELQKELMGLFQRNTTQHKGLPTAIFFFFTI